LLLSKNSQRKINLLHDVKQIDRSAWWHNHSFESKEKCIGVEFIFRRCVSLKFVKLNFQTIRSLPVFALHALQQWTKTDSWLKTKMDIHVRF